MLCKKNLLSGLQFQKPKYFYDTLKVCLNFNTWAEKSKRKNNGKYIGNEKSR